MNPRTPPSFAALAASIDELCVLTDAYVIDASLAASAADDLALIRSQVARASETVGRLASCAENQRREELHRLNNALTGIISLASLCGDDVAGQPELASQLRATERRARAAAQAIRELSLDT